MTSRHLDPLDEALDAALEEQPEPQPEEATPIHGGDRVPRVAGEFVLDPKLGVFTTRKE